MAEPEPDRYERLLQSHLSINPKTWEALQSRGIDERTSLRLDFEYTAPGEDEVRALMRHLRTTTDYEFQGGARDQQDGTQRWLLLGSTSPATWSLDKLNAWVTEMTAHGRDHGPAVFDGWGVQAPEAGTAEPASLSLKDLIFGRLRRRAR
jgi:Regulator of ribonuclease activity B